MITILFLMGAGICVFLGAFVETVVIDLYPSMYGWNIAVYVLAGIFALWGIIELFKAISHKRRRKAARQGDIFLELTVNTQKRSSAPKSKPAANKNVNNKKTAGKPAGQRKQGKR